MHAGQNRELYLIRSIHNIILLQIAINKLHLSKIYILAGPTSLAASTNFGVGDGPIVARVACSGTEVQVMDCVFNITHGCVHDDDVTLRCTATGTGKNILLILRC